MARLWTLRLLVVAGGYEHLIDDDGNVHDAAVASWLQLHPAAGHRRQILRRLHDHYLHAEGTALPANEVPALRNASRLAGCLEGLGSIEILVLAFLALMEHPALGLQRTASRLPAHSYPAVRLMLAAALGVAPVQLGQALSPAGRLAHTGLIRLPSSPNTLADCASLALPSLARHLIPLREARRS